LKKCVLLICCSTFVSAALGGTIVSISGPDNGAGFALVGLVLIPSWTQTSAYTDVAISAVVSGVPGDSFTAYLTTQVGPGTTIADEIAEVTLAYPGLTDQSVTLFQGLSLPAGTYYLSLSSTLSSHIPDGWATTFSPDVFSDSGVTLNTFQDAIAFAGVYPPAQTLFIPNGVVPNGDIDGELLQVTGTVMPEPGSSLLLLAGVLGVLIRRVASRNFSLL
jgi:hypothetical protein